MTSRVHVVCRNADGDRVLPRLAQALMRGTPWTIGPGPDPNADLNLAFPYLEWRPDWPTHSAAFFTHLEEADANKAAAWDRVAAAVDLRIVAAGRYYAALAATGPTARVTPPLDREMFWPRLTAPHNERPRLGTAGWVYPTGRKGEGMLATLVERLGDAVEWAGSGEGWPVPTEMRPWADMGDYYRSLDLYVCTSLIEGIGYPPLEALACGVPVVVPMGVGIFDELPHAFGLVRYQAGNVDALEAAVRIALDYRDDINRAALTQTVDAFTVEAWAEDHRRAVAAVLEGVAA